MFKIAAGVRQGGVLSPVLFAVYVHVDDIIVNLKSSGFGCYFAGEYIGVFMYAENNIFSLPMVSGVKYLGVVISAGKRFKISIHLKRMKFYRAFNALWSKVGGKAPDIVILHLIRSFCLPILLYGLEAVPVSESLCNSVKCCWSRVLFRIFHISSTENIHFISIYTGILPINEKLNLRKLRFVQSLCMDSHIVHSLSAP